MLIYETYNFIKIKVNKIDKLVLTENIKILTIAIDSFSLNAKSNTEKGSDNWPFIDKKILEKKTSNNYSVKW